MTSGRATDWASIEALYRAGDVSIREIARIHDVSEATIRAHARKEGWIRNLKERVRTAIHERLAREDAHKDAPAGQKLSDEAIVDAAARAGTAVVRRQRATVNEAHERVIAILIRIKATFEDDAAIEEIKTAINEDTAEPEGGEHPLERMARLARRRKLMQLISLPAQIGQMQGIASTLKNIVPLERIVFGLSEKGEGGEDEGVVTRDEVLKQLSVEVSGRRFQPN